MNSDLKELNSELYGRAIIKYIDINKYPEILANLGIQDVRVPTQILIDNTGVPYKTDKSAVYGYENINDEAGNAIFSVHDGHLTYEDIVKILQDMGLKSK